MRARRQVQRVRDEKFPSVYSSPQSSDAPTNASVPKRQHLDWSPVFINPVYRSSPRKIARTTTGPAAYAPLLVQHALSLGACSQEAEGRAGKTRIQIRPFVNEKFVASRVQFLHPWAQRRQNRKTNSRARGLCQIEQDKCVMRAAFATSRRRG